MDREQALAQIESDLIDIKSKRGRIAEAGVISTAPGSSSLSAENRQQMLAAFDQLIDILEKSRANLQIPASGTE